MLSRLRKDTCSTVPCNQCPWRLLWLLMGAEKARPNFGSRETQMLLSQCICMQPPHPQTGRRFALLRDGAHREQGLC